MKTTTEKMIYNDARNKLKQTRGWLVDGLQLFAPAKKKLAQEKRKKLKEQKHDDESI